MSRRFNSTFALLTTGMVLLAGVPACSPHPPPPPAPAPPTAGVAESARPPQLQWPAEAVPGVDNFGVVSADVWRGAKPTSDGFRTLAAMGVGTIIDLQESDESADVPAGVRYVPLRTSHWHVDRVDTAAVLKAIADNPKPVFIHCLAGSDRTGLAVGAYCVSTGMSADEAVRQLDQYHVHVWWRSSIVRRIHELAKPAIPTAGPAGATPRPAAG